MSVSFTVHYICTITCRILTKARGGFWLNRGDGKKKLDNEL